MAGNQIPIELKEQALKVPPLNTERAPPATPCMAVFSDLPAALIVVV